MNAGKYNTPIQIINYQQVTDEYGSISKVEDYGKSTKAFIKYNRGSKGVEDYELFNSEYITIIVRSYITVNYQSVIKYNNNEYTIISIERDNLNNCIRIEARRINI